eukprot:5114106-Amphidinium_carterae.1
MECRKTRERAPGPGPIRKKEWGEIAEIALQPLTEPIIMHTDSAKAYNLKIFNVHHTRVIHQWSLVSSMLREEGEAHDCEEKRVFWAGTQTIDGLWQALWEECKSRVTGEPDHVNGFIRVAQFKHWCSGGPCHGRVGPL